MRFIIRCIWYSSIKLLENNWFFNTGRIPGGKNIKIRDLNREILSYNVILFTDVTMAARLKALLVRKFGLRKVMGSISPANEIFTMRLIVNSIYVCIK